ncbi:iron ABC transporter permease [Nocardia sp. NBC_01503]|uniref:ABC transporter permease n=1 Tax=Nocardia sp. NBC_01503 TaxID=2975997 RepID=UPI002E7ACA15|nr:iron ABC transporter permease [Nocardia sp. NBC_01503]WTL32774.1 iron ABC transporter permease [Nocardia sp. NBC_01503]
MRVWIPAAVLLPLVVMPMTFLVYGSLQSAPPGQSGLWTLRNYDVLLSGEFLELVGNSLLLAAAVTAIALALGAVLAIALTRWDVPAAKFFDSVTIIPAYIPAFVGAIAWSFLLAPRSGYLNAPLAALGLPAVNIYSWGGVIGVLSVYSVPVVYLNLRPALLSVSKSSEEAGRLLGASRFRVAHEILLPAVRPAILSSALIVFINTLGDFAVVGVLGVRAHIDVVALRIVELTTKGVFDTGRAAVLGVVLAMFSVVALSVIVRGLAHRDLATIGARHSTESATTSRALRLLGLALCLSFALITVVLPVAVLVIGSLQPYLSTTFSSGWTIDNYALMARYPGALTSITNSVLLSFLAATVCAFLSAVLAYIVVRRQGWLGTLVEYLSMSPLAVPHMVFAVALVWAWVGTSGVFYGTKWILLAAYVALFLPYSMRAAVTAFQQLDPVLEDAGRISGARWPRVMLRIVTPLVLPGILAGVIIVLYHTMKEISASLVLYPPGEPVISVVIWSLSYQGQFAQLFALCVVYIALIFALVASISALGRRYMRL